VGKVQARDENGIRLRLIDWLVGEAVGWDFFVPWQSITASLMAVPGEHDIECFGEAAAQWQERCNAMRTKQSAESEKES
jgi:hypothetical protein